LAPRQPHRLSGKGKPSARAPIATRGGACAPRTRRKSATVF